MANTGCSGRPEARRQSASAGSTRIGPYPSSRTVPAPTRTTSQSLRNRSNTRLSATLDSPAERPSAVTAPSTLETKFTRSQGSPPEG